MAADRQRFVVSGSVEEAETGRPLGDLVVRAFDRDLVFDDKLGYTSTDADGRFEIRFSPEDFRDFRETAPDLYLRIFDRAGTRLIFETRDAIRWNASPNERYRIRIPASALKPR